MDPLLTSKQPLCKTNANYDRYEIYLTLINLAGGLCGRIFTEVVSTDPRQ